MKNYEEALAEMFNRVMLAVEVPESLMSGDEWNAVGFNRKKIQKAAVEFAKDRVREALREHVQLTKQKTREILKAVFPHPPSER